MKDNYFEKNFGKKSHSIIYAYIASVEKWKTFGNIKQDSRFYENKTKYGL